MPIPAYHEFYLPLLQFLSDGKEHSVHEYYAHAARHFNLTQEEQAEYIPSGGQLLYKNRAGWAKTYLKKAGFIKQNRRGYIIITLEGSQLLENSPHAITEKDLMHLPKYREFKNGLNEGSVTDQIITVSDLSPEEILQESHKQLRAQLADEILELLKQCSPYFFERVVLDVLKAMGYGGSVTNSGQRTQRSRDNGIDGIIKQDPLGLDKVYVQAKRWKDNVSAPTVREFIGSLQDHKAVKGVIITTSDFTSDAVAVAERSGHIVLVSGQELAQYMMDHNVGVEAKAVFEIKKLNRDYFEES